MLTWLQHGLRRQQASNRNVLLLGPHLAGPKEQEALLCQRRDPRQPQRAQQRGDGHGGGALDVIVERGGALGTQPAQCAEALGKVSVNCQHVPSILLHAVTWLCTCVLCVLCVLSVLSVLCVL